MQGIAERLALADTTGQIRISYGEAAVIVGMEDCGINIFHTIDETETSCLDGIIKDHSRNGEF